MDSISTPRQREVRTKYCNLMLEVRHRLDFLMRLNENYYKLPSQPAGELGYIQLRMICETIALGCLIVHGDVIAVNAKTRSSYQADAILNALSRLHPSFFPEPGTPINVEDGGRQFNVFTGEYMTKDMLLKLYFECGGRLHRGTYESVGSLVEIPFEPIHASTSRFVALLKFHRIAFLGTEDQLWVHMVHPQSSNVRATLERPLTHEPPTVTDDDLAR